MEEESKATPLFQGVTRVKNKMTKSCFQEHGLYSKNDTPLENGHLVFTEKNKPYDRGGSYKRVVLDNSSTSKQTTNFQRERTTTSSNVKRKWTKVLNHKKTNAFRGGRATRREATRFGVHG